MKEIIFDLVLYANYLSLLYIIAVNTVNLFQLLFASFKLTSYSKTLRHLDYKRLAHTETMLPISILVPAFNEEATIVDNLQNLLNLNYPEYEVIVTNDGSKDNTLNLLIDTFELIKINEPYNNHLETEKIKQIYRTAKYPNLIVIDKENGGKADALNAGINVSHYPIFVAIDADSLLEKDSLIKIIMPFFYNKDVIAVGGIIRIASGCGIKNGQLVKIDLSKNNWVRLQTVEYLRAFLTGRTGFDAFDSLLIISGAFGAFKKDLVIEAGGYVKGCIGEDMELVVTLHKHMIDNNRKYKITFIPDSVCWTQPPDTFKGLRNQRRRWHIGLMTSLFKHKNMVANAKYGGLGLFGLPYFWLFEYFGPIIETVGYILVPISYFLGIVDVEFMITFYLISLLYGIILFMGSLLLEEYIFKTYNSTKHLFQLILYVILYNVGYCQLQNLFKIEAMFKYNTQKHSWGSIKRNSFEQAK